MKDESRGGATVHQLHAKVFAAREMIAAQTSKAEARWATSVVFRRSTTTAAVFVGGLFLHFGMAMEWVATVCVVGGILAAAWRWIDPDFDWERRALSAAAGFGILLYFLETGATSDLGAFGVVIVGLVILPILIVRAVWEKRMSQTRH